MTDRESPGQVKPRAFRTAKGIGVGLFWVALTFVGAGLLSIGDAQQAGQATLTAPRCGIAYSNQYENCWFTADTGTNVGYFVTGTYLAIGLFLLLTWLGIRRFIGSRTGDGYARVRSAKRTLVGTLVLGLFVSATIGSILDNVTSGYSPTHWCHTDYDDPKLSTC